MKILKQFSQSKEHANAQCCIVCLMSHGEEGSLTVQDGRKVSYIDIILMKINDFFFSFFLFTDLSRSCI